MISVIKDSSLAEVFLRFSPDGRELARLPQFGSVLLSDTASYKKARTFPVGMRMVAYSPDGSRLATAEGTDGARIWDATAPGKLLTTAPNEIRMLENPIQVLASPSKDPKQRVFWTEFSPDGKRLITAQANGHVKIWTTASWTLEDDLALTDSEVRAAAFSPDCKTLVIGDVNGALHHWSFENKKAIKSDLTRESLDPITQILFAPDGKTLVTSHQSRSNSTVRIWNTGTWTPQLETGFNCAAFSKNGKVLALGGRNLKLLDPASGKEIRTIELPELTRGEFGPQFEKQPNADKKVPNNIRALAFSPDGNTLAVASMGPLRLVEMTSFINTLGK